MAFGCDDALQDACMLTAWCQNKANRVLQYCSTVAARNCDQSLVRDVFLSCLCARVLKQPQLNLSAGLKVNVGLMKENILTDELNFICKSNHSGIFQTPMS